MIETLLVIGAMVLVVLMIYGAAALAVLGMTKPPGRRRPRR